YPVKTDADIAQAMLALGRDITFSSEMRTWARMVTAAGRKAFLYQFTQVPPGPEAAYRGAYHASEIQYVFANLKNPAFAYTQTARLLADAMSSYGVNFAPSGDPNGTGLFPWPAYAPTDEPYLQLGTPIQSRQHLLKAQLDFLETARRRRATQ